MVPRYTFSRECRLRHRNDFNDIFQNGKYFSHYPVKTAYCLQAGDSACLFGVTAPKKLLKKAPDRNRVKRLLREAIRRHKPALELLCAGSGVYFKVLFIYQDNKLPTYSIIEQKLILSLAKLAELAQHGTDSKNT
jgi:ribonuclease P protein component